MGQSRAGTRIGTTLGDAIGPGGAGPSPSGNGHSGPLRPGRGRRDYPAAKAARRRRRRRAFVRVCVILLAALIVGMIGGALSGIV